MNRHLQLSNHVTSSLSFKILGKVILLLCPVYVGSMAKRVHISFGLESCTSGLAQRQMSLTIPLNNCLFFTVIYDLFTFLQFQISPDMLA